MEGAHYRRFGQPVGGHRQAAAPVRPLVDGARQVDLLGLPHQVVDLHHQHAGRRAGEVAVDGGGQRRGQRRAVGRFGIDARGKQPLAGEGVEQQSAVMVAACPLAVRGLGRRIEPDSFLEVDIVRVPEAGERRQVVGGDAGERQRRILVRPLEPVAVLFEIEHLVGQDVHRRHPLAKSVRHRAQILADDQASVAVALQGEDAQQVLERILHIAAGRRRIAARNPEQVHEAHGMIDAQRAGVAHVGADDGDERLVGHVGEGERMQRRCSPVLAHHVDRIRRRSDRGPVDDHVLGAPRVGAVGGGADGQIAVKTDGEAAFPRPARRSRELEVRLPLHVLEELDAGASVAGEGLDLRRVRPPIGLGPLLPGRAVEPFRQRLEQGETAEPFAALPTEPSELPGPAVVLMVLPETVVEQRQHLLLEGDDRAIFDNRRTTGRGEILCQRRHRFARLGAFGEVGNRLHIQVDGVEEHPAAWRVGTGEFRVAAEQRVQRV